ncbi:nuclear transport factor 2 family protein [Pararhodobacter oceanensis]|uniref:nuclear transport factor 2 family protein n=1 Tax=Pararhodobacter oceanensis TaxID=2172121 RepID=UPI003A8CF0C4
MSDALTYHQRFSPEEFDAQYNLRAGRPNYEETVVPDWIARSAATRETRACKLDVRYGNGPKQLLDVFHCGDAQAPTLVFIHGGYWQRGDKSVYSFIAEPFIAAGVNVVLLGYDLCPEVTITHISAEIREGVAFVYRHAAELGVNRERLTVMGHSAGGHLTQMMMATDWPAYGADLPADLVKTGVPVSPLSYLEPVRMTEALNAALRMDAQEAERESPMTQHPPLTNAPQLVVVGGRETDEFHRQARIYAEKYATEARRIDVYVVPDVDHFDELNTLADPASDFFHKTCAMLGLNRKDPTMKDQTMTELTREFVDAVGDAFNANDVDAVMAYIDDNIVFDHAAGPEAYGVRFEGAETVRGVFKGLFDKVENVHWKTLDCRIAGDKAYCEYLRTATHKDGTKEEYQSIDIMTFKDGKMVYKDTYYKIRNT